MCFAVLGVNTRHSPLLFVLGTAMSANPESALPLNYYLYSEVRVPAADLRVHDNQPVRTTMMDGISTRTDVLFTNEKGEEKQSVQKRTQKILRKLSPALQRIILPDEAMLYAMRARSPLSVVEQLTAAWWTALLAACAIVVTNKRILFFPIKRDGSWRESVRSVHWGDLQEIKAKGLFVKNVSFKFRNGTITTYTNFRRGDAKKLSAIASALIPPASGEQTSAHSLIQLCPDCCGVLTQGQYSCPGCGLIFKNERTMVLRSIILPGGGYFYTGHPLIAILPAIVEAFFLVEVLLILFAGLASPKAVPNLFSVLLVLGVFWALETGVTILHCRRYIREFIPEKRDPARLPQAAFPGAP
jgi:PH (Pleckstrin Homology) domain-containing protein